ncbi:MAG: 1-deoxy-D-xylulose-5-phosphate synthase [Clostridiaceae bacterium]|jgi:1-deoxy-D-xylulose-5-phosphate synthase|nr:1-deoxy-D-xylulose-5-phosphate synthase [Clostridiaceae bacterium]
MHSEYPLLDSLNLPQDLAKLSYEEKVLLAEELRSLIIKVTSENGGHLASNLGVIELVIAILALINPKDDKVIFDVGHQSYAWKILTDRYKQFDTLRQKDGLSGFPKMEESPYDAFGTGHSSTSISAAVGYSRAMRTLGKKGKVIALIGDGALSGGMAYEAMNDAAQSNDPLLVILNDNQMSIDECVGGMARYLEQLRVKPSYLSFKSRWEERLNKLKIIGPPLLKILSKLKYKTRSWHKEKGIVFEQIGFRYYGPIDGHNIEGLERHIKAAQSVRGPAILHVITKKGLGYAMAETEPSRYHGVSPFPMQYGLSDKNPDDQKTFSDVFGNSMLALAERDEKVVAITAAMAQGTGLCTFKKQYPDRFFDVGIAEQHALTLAAGLAAGGAKPVVALYSTFLQRGMDQLIHDICLQNLPVIIAVDRAGLVGSDGPTHQGLYDLTMTLNLPNLAIMTPATAIDLERCLLHAHEYNGPVMIRYPRDLASTVDLISLDENMLEPQSFKDLQKMRHVRSGSDLTVLAVGPMILQVLLAIDSYIGTDYSIDLYSVVTIKPLEANVVLKSTKKTGKLLIVEDGCLSNGFGQKLIAELSEEQPGIVIKAIGVKDVLRGQATRAELFQAEGLDPEGLAQRIMKLIGR